MKDLISALEDLELQLRNFQEFLREEEWDSKEASSAAIDIILYAGMTAQATKRLRGLLTPPVEPKVEPEHPAEEEKGGEDLGEQVSGEEVHEEHPSKTPQEPEAEGPESP